MESDIILAKAVDYRLTIMFKVPISVIDETINKFYTDASTVKSPIPNTAIVDISKFEEEDNGDIVNGLKFILIKMGDFIIDFEKNVDDTFYIKLINETGEAADKCIRTGVKVPYLFRYCNKRLNVYDTVK